MSIGFRAAAMKKAAKPLFSYINRPAGTMLLAVSGERGRARQAVSDMVLPHRGHWDAQVAQVVPHLEQVLANFDAPLGALAQPHPLAQQPVAWPVAAPACGLHTL